jgi:hypothetical protein
MATQSFCKNCTYCNFRPSLQKFFCQNPVLTTSKIDPVRGKQVDARDCDEIRAIPKHAECTYYEENADWPKPVFPASTTKRW